MERTTKQRNKASRNTDAENATANQEDEKEVRRENSSNTFKYYFNRFRYYHYCFAEKLDSLIGLVCRTIIRIYVFLMGWDTQLGQNEEIMNLIDVDYE
ncbi:uncharacterized protein LOC108628545 [Ceratina calcarata]|uniref:Uncharacterized protein LOC108628545 n=1 Tax=Ceratina calcarata TaxID=156304 RepID=A0AAJ7NBA7_9HYME|nr:uncharacterized protein LOC108628545 [Ceratina calcarata]